MRTQPKSTASSVEALSMAQAGADDLSHQMTVQYAPVAFVISSSAASERQAGIVCR